MVSETLSLEAGPGRGDQNREWFSLTETRQGKRMASRTVRILHVPARSGGTLVGKCLAVMDEALLLQRIHPYAIGPIEPVSARPADGSISRPRGGGAARRPERFVEAIALVRERAEARGKKLILREWSHIDFYGRPYNEDPGWRPSSPTPWPARRPCAGPP